MNEEKLEQYLKLFCKGKARTKRSGEIEKAVGISGNELRRLVNRMRRRGIPIGSSRDGYFYAVTAGEVYGTIRKLREMANGLESVITGLPSNFKRVWGSFSGTTNFFGVKPLKLKDALERLIEVAKRLEGTVIKNKDAIRLIYCDSPYYDAEQYYDAAFSKEDHVRLHDTLKECKGYVIVSYNDCEEIRKLYSDFHLLSFTRQNPMAQQTGATYEELLITNYDPRPFAGQMTLFESPLEFGGMRLIHIPEKPLKII